MTREKAIIISLKIVEECKNNQNNCLQCPFNIRGCIVGCGNEIPTEWQVNEIFDFYKRERG